MKKLPPAVRAKAISIGNAMLKEKKKLKQSSVVTAAIRKAKALVGKPKKTGKASAKAKAKKTTRTTSTKRRPSTVKTKPAIARKSRKGSVARKPVARRTVKATSGPILKKRERSKVLQRMRKKEKPAPPPAAPFIDPAQTVPAKESNGMHPITPLESHRIEQGMHRREEAAMRAENQKIKNVLASRKNLKRTYRMFGNR